MTPPLIFSWFDHTLNTRTNLKRIIGIRPHTTSRLNQYTVLPPLPLSILSESLIILFQPQVPQISHTLDKQICYYHLSDPAPCTPADFYHHD